MLASTVRTAVMAIAAALTGASATRAAATEFCVVCSDPDGVYRCVAPDVSVEARNTGAQLLCIQEIARRQGHRTCTIERNPKTACNGPEWTIAGGSVSPVTALPSSTRGGIAPDGTSVSPSMQAREPILPPPSQDVKATAEPSGGPLGAGDGTTYYPGRAPGVVTGEPSAPSPAAANETQPSGKSGNALEKAGTAVSGAAKKTWDCMSSLFTKC